MGTGTARREKRIRLIGRENGAGAAAGRVRAARRRQETAVGGFRCAALLPTVEGEGGLADSRWLGLGGDTHITHTAAFWGG
ncbi:unnamed protein product [Linum trigynum]|uniref:Uncharacterized protein n=1 Tax=Linum trigynum TaxID=586398 RepID=A0AAV2F2Q6_9ROSI